MSCPRCLVETNEFNLPTDYPDDMVSSLFRTERYMKAVYTHGRALLQNGRTADALHLSRKYSVNLVKVTGSEPRCCKAITLADASSERILDLAAFWYLQLFARGRSSSAGWRVSTPC